MEVQSVRFLVGTSRGDRLFQMNYALYAYQGRLAQLHGDVWDALDYDKSMRLRGQWRRAVAAAQNLGEDSLILLEAYSAGVNEWMAAHPEDRHALFAELDMEPITWTPAHCLASWLRLGQFFTGSTGLDKAGDYHDFLATEQGQGTEAAIAAYWEAKGGLPHPGDSNAGVVQASDVPQDVQDAIATYAEQHGYGDAAETSGQPASTHPFYYNHVVPKMSQAWAVGGSRTTSGEAVLVNNGQASVQWPPVLYEFHLEGQSIRAHGAGTPGSPGDPVNRQRVSPHYQVVHSFFPKRIQQVQKVLVQDGRGAH